jgi:XRE family transcriptional regulator, aerobic/anaerobic benzoate catabolism transcriptional regulator
VTRSRFLKSFGERIRGLRARRGMSRKLLAKHAGISERYITQLESGKGNISIVLLKRIADAFGLPLARLFDDEPPRRIPTADRERAHRIALVGLRGAGKTTLGQRLAREMEVPFFELDREIERISGVSLAHILEMYGQQAYRRYEVQALQELLSAEPRLVVATGGSLVSEPATYELLLRSCFTIWVRTTPEEHMARVIAQGDQRPMAGSTQAMEDLRRILQEREPLYARADLTVDTTGTRPEQSVSEVLRGWHLCCKEL